MTYPEREVTKSMACEICKWTYPLDEMDVLSGVLLNQYFLATWVCRGCRAGMQ